MSSRHFRRQTRPEYGTIGASPVLPLPEHADHGTDALPEPACSSSGCVPRPRRSSSWRQTARAGAALGEQHRRLREAAALVCNPDVRARRTMAKALARRRRRERSTSTMVSSPRLESARCAGSRCSRPRTSSRRRDFCRTTSRPPTMTRRCRSARDEPIRSIATSASRSTRAFIISTIGCAPSCGDVNFAKRSELADLRGRVALLTGGRVEDRLPDRPQAAALGCAPHRHHPVPARFGRPLRAGAGLRGVGQIGWKSTASDLRHMRRVSKPSAASSWRPAAAST